MRENCVSHLENSQDDLISGCLSGDTGSEATETDRRIMGRETTLGPSRFNVSMLTATCAMYFNGKDKDHRVLTSRKQ